MAKKLEFDTNALNKLLNARYGFSYTGFSRALPPDSPGQPGAPPAPPQLGGYAPGASPGAFSQLPGYFLEAAAGYSEFEGNGNLHGVVAVSRGGSAIAFPVIVPTRFQHQAPKDFTGTYYVNGDGFTGGFRSILAPTEPVNPLINDHITLDWFFVMVNDWQELKFVAINSNFRRPVISGTMTRE